MPFRIEHGSVKNISTLAKQAGSAKRQADDQTRLTELSFQKAMQAQESQNQMRLLAYKQELDLQAAKMAQDWEVEKAVLNSQENFRRFQYEKSLLHERELLNKIRDQEELRNKIKALNDHKDILTEDEYRRGMVSILTGLRDKADPLSSLMSSYSGPMGTQPTATTTTEPAMTVNGVPYFQTEEGQITTQSPAPEVPEIPTNLLNPDSAYMKSGWGPFKRTKANIPVMRNQIRYAIPYLTNDPAVQQQLQEQLSNASDKDIESTWQQIRESLNTTVVRASTNPEVNTIANQFGF